MNDVALEQVALVEEKLRLRYLASVCDMQLKYARRRNEVHASKLQAWIHSTHQKDAFAWSMVRAKCVRQPNTQSEICNFTNISRQSVSEMIKHCLSQGWINVYCDQKEIEPNDARHCKGSLKYDAAQELMMLANDYIERHINTTEDTYMNKNWDDLMAIRRVRGAIL